MGEPDLGVTAGLANLWASFEDMALDPTDTAARLAVIGSLDDVAGRIRTIAQSWDAAGAHAANDIAGRVTEANQLLDQVAKLNGEIDAATAESGTPNDLLDAHDLALDRLATLAGTTATITEKGTARVSLNGLALVHDLQVSRLSFDDATTTILHSSGASVRPGGEIAGLHGFVTTASGASYLARRTRCFARRRTEHPARGRAIPRLVRPVEALLLVHPRRIPRSRSPWP